MNWMSQDHVIGVIMEQFLPLIHVDVIRDIQGNAARVISHVYSYENHTIYLSMRNVSFKPSKDDIRTKTNINIPKFQDS